MAAPDLVSKTYLSLKDGAPLAAARSDLEPETRLLEILVSATEDEIRDRLAPRLELLEPGLRALKTELHLPNIHGSSGFVDIFARDALGNVVLIELKRSDAASREAIHELFKYVALLCQNHRVQSHRIRCMVVSTDWREPFSSFVRAAQFPVQGFRLSVSESGEAVSADAVTPVPDVEDAELGPTHWAACCTSRAQRDEVLRRLSALLANAGVEDYLVFFIDHDLSNPAVIHPLLCYVLLARIATPLREHMLSSNVLGVADYGDAENPDWAVEEAIASQLHAVDGYDSAEFGFPEQLSGMLNDTWTVVRIVRHGVFSSASIYPDPTLISLATGMEGANAVFFTAVTRPTFVVQWRTLLEGLRRTLLGNSAWTVGVLGYLQEIATALPNSTVAIHVYNPMDCLTHLNMGATLSNPRYLPSLQVISGDPGTATLRILSGGWNWDGRVPPSPHEIIARTFGGFEQYFLARVMHSAWELEDEICTLHGLRYGLQECLLCQDQAPLLRELRIDGGQARWSPTLGPDTTLRDFISRNRPYLAKLSELFRSNTFGSP